MSDLLREYQTRHDEVLRSLSNHLGAHLQRSLEGLPRIDRISARPKSVERFIAKANATVNGQPKYAEPLDQIQDQVGARIITFYKSDVAVVSREVLKFYRPVESRDLVPESEWEFGYFGKHHVMLIPTDIVDPDWDPDLVPQFFELQIKTLFQHAWSEANHDLGYKPGAKELTPDQKRSLAFTSAQAWGADRIFDELFTGRTEGNDGH